jgi:hypothetical protein
MLIDCKEEFLIRSSNFGNSKATHELYKLYSDSIAKFNKAADLYMDVLRKYSPKDALKILHLDNDFHCLSQQQIEKEFLNAMVMAAKYEFVQRNFYHGVNWAKKGLDLFELFYSKYPENVIKSMKEKSEEYRNLKTQFNTYRWKIYILAKTIFPNKTEKSKKTMFPT